ncbi:uncharacterized protein LOC116779535 isoform X2 [Danaus plexippus]|uniref:uncharacterized protein LOC116779535 isoform X2 n=1 Tax=Danaus plexippus TaxID=13037 RepID=UPI002AB10160|nr:uncharacterized protein LOC116779535 isoform X2 [Danaus plexippus]
MGICLDTEQNNEELETVGERSRRESTWPATPSGVPFPMQNSSHVKFEPPAVPVIFVLGLLAGGPGSGKVTHCDNLMQERRGMVHINMTDLLQQYAIGNDMLDFGTLSSKTVTEVLMLEMKMAPTARTYLVSGYPRSMRDVAEYSDKIQTISGVVLVSWRQRVLERQIEYGARLGQVVLSLAKMELSNFYKHVMPVADYFDQSNMLIAVNGERNPEEVYRDFKAAVLQILGSYEDQNSNGIGVGARGIQGEIVGVEPAPTRDQESPRPVTQHVDIDDSMPNEPVTIVQAPVTVAPVPRHVPNGNVGNAERIVSPKAEVIRVRGAATSTPTLWVVGGPGSNKAALCQRAVEQRQGWTHFSVGQRLRALADVGGGLASDGALARTAVTGGELAPHDLVTKLVNTAVQDATRTGHGIVLDGYPRDLEQMTLYEREFKVTPRMVLLDCSKLQLGRGRRDDSVAAFRRRLEVFRELSLPMLKNLDQQHRLVIVDGDTDSADVQAEFTRVLLEEMERAEEISKIPSDHNQRTEENHFNRRDGTAVQQFAHVVSRVGTTLANGTARNGAANGSINGFIGVHTNKVKPMVSNASKIPSVSQMTHDDVRRLYEQSSGEIALNTHM